MNEGADHGKADSAPNGRAQHFFEGCGPLRAGKGLTKTKLAQESGIDRSTLDKIEAHKVPVTEERIRRVFNYLNERLYGGMLDPEKYITTANKIAF